ncbi:Dimer Tnp hAT domain-containing protein, partial [Aphis craccivora]
EEQSMTAINHLTNIWIHMKNLEKEHEELTMSDINTDNLSESEVSCNSKSGDEIEEFLKSNYLNASSSQNDLSNSQKSTISTRIETLLKSYHIEQNRIGNKTNILKFWKSMETIHPELHELAKVVFSVPGTQVSVERLFSGLKYILSPYRTNIGSKNLEDQLLVRTNRLFEKKETEKFISGNPIIPITTLEPNANQNQVNTILAVKRKKKQMLLTNMISK